MKRLNQLDMKKKKYIIFDMDGTLIDSIGVWNTIDQRLVLKYTNKYVDETTIQTQRDTFLNANKGNDTYIEYCRFLIKLYKMDTDINSLMRDRVLFSDKMLSKELDYKSGAPELLYKLKEMGYTLVLATMTTKQQIDVYAKENKKMAKAIDLYKVFDYITTIEDVKEKKPNPEIYLNIMKHFNATCDECLIFEDSLTGVLSACNANIEVINIYDSYADINREEIDKISDYKIRNFYEFIQYLKREERIRQKRMK